MKQYYAIFLYETKLQKEIVDYLIRNLYIGKSILVIKREKNWLYIDGSKYYFNFHSRLSGFFSLVLFPLLRNRLSKIKCVELCAPFIPAFNARVLAIIIEHKIKCNIEDGLGTFTGINFPVTMIPKISFYPANIFLGRKIESLTNVITNIHKYYTIYGRDKYKNVLSIDKVMELDLLAKEYPELSDDVYFVGQPLVQNNMIMLSDYIGIVNKLAKKYGKIKYFYHPVEHLQYDFNDNIKIYRINEALESYIEKNDKPKVVISYVSTVLMSVRMKYPDIECFYIDSQLADEKIRYVLELFGIKKYEMIGE